MIPAIHVTQLSKIFHPARGLAKWLSPSCLPHKIEALRDVTFDVFRGEVFGLLGSNGAGKTTLLKILATLIRPDRGDVSVCGYGVVQDERHVRARIGFVAADERSFHWRLTGRQNLRFSGSLLNLSGGVLCERIEEMTELLEMAEFLDRRVDSYSAGMKQRLAVARGLLARPEVLLMDEPTRGLDPVSARKLLESVRSLADSERTTVLMVTHQLSEASRICDRIAVLHRGRVERIDAVGELIGSTEASGTYVIYGKIPAGVSREWVGALPAVRKCSVEGNCMEVELWEPEKNLGSLLERMLKKDFKISKIELKNSKLEEIYLEAVKKEAV
ncbi:MAG: ABC transporter ATP-binding protein [bacterium]|nr:ABC transporter ATP-binding protein [bacterium]